MVNQSVYRRHRHHGIRENRIPLTKGLIGREQETSTLVTIGYQLKQHGRLRLRFLDVAQVIEHQQIKLVELLQLLVKTPLLLLLLQELHHRRGMEETHSFTKLYHREGE